MRKVLTIHGVGFLGGQGPWQEAVAKVIQPHFSLSPHKYSYYRWAGLFSAVFEPWVFVPCMVAVIFYLRRADRLIFWMSVVAVLIASSIVARVRRRAAIHGFESKHFKTPYQLNPHVIAHSMGTQLAGSVLKKFPTVSYSHVILAGCVLPRDYPWCKMVDHGRVDKVRNEVGANDPVPLIALGANQVGLLPGFGSAGRHGFVDSSGCIHSTEPDTACPDCSDGNSARIHTVLCPFEHSGAMTAQYAALYWLPWLWAIEPAEYSKWLQMCLAADAWYTAYKAKQHDSEANLQIAEEELLYTTWGWAKGPTPGQEKGATLEQYITRLLQQHQRKKQGPVTAMVLLETYRGFARACRAHHEPGAGWEREILSLNPGVAVIRAVEFALR